MRSAPIRRKADSRLGKIRITRSRRRTSSFSVFLPGPCYQTTMTVIGGASGGPVFNKYGKVIGVNSTGYDGQQISFVSRIHEALTFKVPDVNIDGKSKDEINMVQLAKLGIISVNNL
jgi:hypothetical protein